MKRDFLFSILLAILTLALLIGSPAKAAQSADVSLFVSCIEIGQAGLPYVWFGYEASEAVTGTGYAGPVDQLGFMGLPPNTLSPGRHDKVFGVELQVEGATAFYQFVLEDGTTWEAWANAESDAPDCDQVGVYGPDGGLKTITKDVAPGCYEWSIEDGYGHWSAVATTCSQAEGDHVFVRLVLGRDNPVTDPERYRVWKVEETEE